MKDEALANAKTTTKTNTPPYTAW